jgi:hypothetical protein
MNFNEISDLANNSGADFAPVVIEVVLRDDYGKNVVRRYPVTAVSVREQEDGSTVIMVHNDIVDVPQQTTEEDEQVAGSDDVTVAE